MAKSYLTPINLNGLELLNARLQQLATAPASPADGIIYYDTTLGRARIRTAGAWVDILAGQVYTDQNAQDAIGALISAGTQNGITVTYNSTSHTLSFAVAADGAPGTATLRTLGTGAQQAAAGTDARLSDTRVPTDGTVTNAKVASGANISADKLADGTTNVIMLATERTKLAGITSDATATTASLRTLGTGALQAASGADARLSDARNPIAGSVTNSSVASNAAISADKLADGTTNVAMLATERTKLAGIASGATANQSDSYLLNRANHTGTQSADTLTNGSTNAAFLLSERTKLSGIATGATNYTDTNARANRLDQFAAPTAAVSMNSQLVTNVATPVSGTDAANKNYVDAARQGVSFKDPVRAATTGNITLSGTQTVDGVALVAGDRVLVKDQTTGSQNGIYVVNASTWPRATDADTTGELVTGTTVLVTSGSANGGQQWVINTTGTITINTTAIAWVQSTGASTTTAGNGLSASGNAFNVGAGTGISVGADAISIDTAVVVQKANFNVGNGSLTSIPLTHNFNTRDVMVQVYLNSGTYEEVEVDIQRTSVNTVTLVFATAPAANAYRAVIQG